MIEPAEPKPKRPSPRRPLADLRHLATSAQTTPSRRPTKSATPTATEGSRRTVWAQSAGKRRSGATRKGSKWLRATLTEASLAATLQLQADRFSVQA